MFFSKTWVYFPCLVYQENCDPKLISGIEKREILEIVSQLCSLKRSGWIIVNDEYSRSKIVEENVFSIYKRFNIFYYYY